MQKLSKDEMKKVIGGSLAPPEQCLTSCGGWTGGSTGHYTTGTCTSGTQTINGITTITCTCGVSGGSSCYPKNNN